jgi:hypothetical protein
MECECRAFTTDAKARLLHSLLQYEKDNVTHQMFSQGWIDPVKDLLYPVYFKPPTTSNVLHQLEAGCHNADLFSQLGMPYVKKNYSPSPSAWNPSGLSDS